MTPDVYFKPHEAAEYIRSSVSSLAKLRVYGGGPAFTRIGRAIRYRRADLDTFMEARIVASTSDQKSIYPLGAGRTQNNPADIERNCAPSYKPAGSGR